jgi:hypothetical protein
MSRLRRIRLLATGFALPAAAALAASPVVLEPTTIADWRAAGMDGTGCYWSRREGGPVLFAAAGNKAVAKVRGRTLLLSPRREARELFPFTFDAWSAGDLTFQIVDTGVAQAIGDESVTTDALLVVARRGTTTRWRGSLICGS